MRKMVSLFVVVLSLLSLFSVTALHAAGVQYGAIQRQGHSTVTAQAPQVVKEHQISIAYAQQLTRELAGVQVASRMLHRVTSPMASQPHVIFGISQTTSSNWGGYVADTSGTSIRTLWQVSLRSLRGGSVCPSGLSNPGTIGVSFSAAPC